MGRVLLRDEEGIHLQARHGNGGIIGTAEWQGNGDCGHDSTSEDREKGISHIDCQCNRLDNRVVGKLQWLVPIRPDLSFVSNELNHTLQSPTHLGRLRQTQARHLLPQRDA